MSRKRRPRTCRARNEEGHACNRIQEILGIAADCAGQCRARARRKPWPLCLRFNESDCVQMRDTWSGGDLNLKAPARPGPLWHGSGKGNVGFRHRGGGGGRISCQFPAQGECKFTMSGQILMQAWCISVALVRFRVLGLGFWGISDLRVEALGFVVFSD